MTEQRRRRDIDDVDIDPDEALAADTEDDHNRDPGADLEDEGVPADDRTSMTGSAPEPERPVAPTDEPVAASEFGTTEREQVAGEPMDDKLDAERPDEPPDEVRPSERADEATGVHVEEATETDVNPPPAQDTPPEEERLGGEPPGDADEQS